MKRLPALRILLLSGLLAAGAGCEILSFRDGSSAPAGRALVLEAGVPDTLAADRATIESARLHGDRLHVVVRYSGGCAAHRFTLYGTRSIIKTLPPKGEAFLSHDDPGDPCDALVTERLVFDVSPLQQAWTPSAGAGTLEMILHEPTGAGFRAAQTLTMQP